MSDTSTKRALEVAKFHEVSEELYADNPEDSGLRAMHHISANLLRALAAERDALRAALQTARRDAREEAASLVDDVRQWDGRDEYCESCKGGAVYPDARDVAATIRALGEKE